MVEQCADKKVSQSVQVEIIREAIPLENLPQMFCKRIRMDERPMLIRKQIWAMFCTSGVFIMSLDVVVGLQK